MSINYISLFLRPLDESLNWYKYYIISIKSK